MTSNAPGSLVSLTKARMPFENSASPLLSVPICPISSIELISIEGPPPRRLISQQDYKDHILVKIDLRERRQRRKGKGMLSPEPDPCRFIPNHHIRAEEVGIPVTEIGGFPLGNCLKRDRLREKTAPGNWSEIRIKKVLASDILFEMATKNPPSLMQQSPMTSKL